MILSASDPRHGTANGYNNLRCRCERCRKAWAAYIRLSGRVARYQRRVRVAKATAEGRAVRKYTYRDGRELAYEVHP